MTEVCTVLCAVQPGRRMLVTGNPTLGYDVGTITSAGLLAVAYPRAQATSEAASVIMATLGGKGGGSREDRGVEGKGCKERGDKHWTEAGNKRIECPGNNALNRYAWTWRCLRVLGNGRQAGGVQRTDCSKGAAAAQIGANHRLQPRFSTGSAQRAVLAG